MFLLIDAWGGRVALSGKNEQKGERAKWKAVSEKSGLNVVARLG